MRFMRNLRAFIIISVIFRSPVLGRRRIFHKSHPKTFVFIDSDLFVIVFMLNLCDLCEVYAFCEKLTSFM